jgi:hypothetical protein
MAKRARRGMVIQVAAANVIKRATHRKESRDLWLFYVTRLHPRSRTDRGHGQQQSYNNHQK